MNRRGLVLPLAVVALGFGHGCTNGAAQPAEPAPPAALGGSGGAVEVGGGGSGTGGAAGLGGAAGAGQGGTSGGGNGAAGSPVMAGAGGFGGSLSCDPMCSGATPVCDTATLTCKTCTAFEGCSGDTPLCDTAANGGLGACKIAEVIAIYTDYLLNMDLAHRSYATDANAWFPSVAAENSFTYEATPDWERVKSVVPAAGRVLVFLDDKPKDAAQRVAFEAYMRGGGAWMGCHFAAYTPGAVEWTWYFNELLGSGDYNGNTWRPTSAQLAVEIPTHPLSQGLGTLFSSQPNEWYRFMTDLRTKPNIQVLVSIDPSSFPLGTGPLPEEIWHEGDYPVVWTNTDYKMLYVNMGHDDMDYGVTNEPLSSTFDSPTQNQMLLNAIRWLSGGDSP